MVLMVERNYGGHLIRRFAERDNEPDPRDVKIASLKQRIHELEHRQEKTRSKREWETLNMENPFSYVTSNLSCVPFVVCDESFRAELRRKLSREPMSLVDRRGNRVFVYSTDIEEDARKKKGTWLLKVEIEGGGLPRAISIDLVEEKECDQVEEDDAEASNKNVMAAYVNL
ncbi:hypothetical protein Tco_0573621 [Tanacetum coccineum]